MAAENRPKFKRKQYLVAKKFQLKYVGLILLLMFSTAILCSYVVYYTSMISLGEKLASVYPQGRLVSIVKAVNFRIMLSVLLVTPLVAVIGIFLSHKIAGPIFRMEKFMANMAAGDLSSKIILRQGDELISLADGINKLVENLKLTIGGQKDRVNMISSEVDNLKKAVSSKPQEVSGSINRLASEVKGLGEELDKYKL